VAHVALALGAVDLNWDSARVVVTCGIFTLAGRAVTPIEGAQTCRDVGTGRTLTRKEMNIRRWDENTSTSQLLTNISPRISIVDVVRVSGRVITDCGKSCAEVGGADVYVPMQHHRALT